MDGACAACMDSACGPCRLSNLPACMPTQPLVSVYVAVGVTLSRAMPPIASRRKLARPHAVRSACLRFKKLRSYLGNLFSSSLCLLPFCQPQGGHLHGLPASLLPQAGRGGGWRRHRLSHHRPGASGAAGPGCHAQVGAGSSWRAWFGCAHHAAGMHAVQRNQSFRSPIVLASFGHAGPAIRHG